MIKCYSRANRPPLFDGKRWRTASQSLGANNRFIYQTIWRNFAFKRPSRRADRTTPLSIKVFTEIARRNARNIKRSLFYLGEDFRDNKWNVQLIIGGEEGGRRKVYLGLSESLGVDSAKRFCSWSRFQTSAADWRSSIDDLVDLSREQFPLQRHKVSHFIPSR